MKIYDGSKWVYQIFVGTNEKYKTAYAAGLIPVGCMVYITDDDEDIVQTDDATSSKLGVGKLGYMILG